MSYTANATIDLSTPPERDLTGRIIKPGTERVIAPGQPLPTGLGKEALQRLLDAGHISETPRVSAAQPSAD